MNISMPVTGKLHRKVVEALHQRKRMWHNDTSDRREKWKRDLENHQAFIHVSADDKLRKKQQDASGKKEYTQIEIPYSYGLIMAFHTYLSSVFLARQPVLQYQERHGANDNSVQAIEAIMDYQVAVGKHLVPYYIWLMDATKHGVGIVGTYWEDEIVRVSKIIEEVPSFGPFALPGGKKKKIKRTIEVPGYKGNRVYNVRPQDFIFDTRVSLANFQDGEFAGRILDMSWLDIIDGGRTGKYMNIDALKKKDGKRSSNFDEHRDTDESVIELPNRGADDHAGINTTEFDIPQTGRLEGYEMVVRLVPKSWGLGKGDRTEKWVFTVINGVVIGARPLGELHNKFPFSVMETEIDGHALFKRSMMEIAEPLNEVLSWLVNTHFFNIRKSLNNMFVADPSRIRTKDFKNPEEGLMIRMRPEAYGQPIANMVHQFDVKDVTATHMSDTKIIAELMQLTLGVNSQLMGLMESTGRKTATEVRGSTGFSMNRLKTQAEYMSALGMAPHSQMMLQSTQQHLDIERYYRLTGDLLPGSQREIMVSPEAIAGFYDFIPVDGTMPVDKLALANLWKELMMGVTSSEELMMTYDIGKIFAYTAQLSGAKNINRFKINLTPDDQLARQRAAGNLIPMNGGTNGAAVGSETLGTPRAAESGRLEDTAARVNEPKQLSGVGPVS
jgi:hypothetical protein